MSSTPSSPPSASGPGRGTKLAVVALIGAGVAILIAVFLVWLVFFSSEAPPAPTIENAIQVLEATAGP